MSTVQDLYITLSHLKGDNGDKALAMSYQDFLDTFQGDPGFAENVYDLLSGNHDNYAAVRYDGSFSEFLDDYSVHTYRRREYIRRKNLTKDQFIGERNAAGEDLYEDIYGELDKPGAVDVGLQWIGGVYKTTKKKRIQTIQEAKLAYEEAMNPERLFSQELDDKDTIEKYIEHKRKKGYYGEDGDWFIKSEDPNVSFVETLQLQQELKLYVHNPYSWH